MIFNSIDFAVFLPIVFILYWFISNKNLKLQNLFICVASYVFYGWWDSRFLTLILFSTIIDYSIGLSLSKQTDHAKRKILLLISVLVNLGLLGYFKYFNFFLENFISAFSFFGMEIKASSIKIILPVGISFYTFQTLSYTIDIYRKKLNPTNDFISFAAFVCFFPQLVAGPIERASNLLPQFLSNRTFDKLKANSGLRQILWGLFKKIVIADNCAVHVNQIFNNIDQSSGSTLMLGAILFAFQIYCDFSGYSDIAIGTARLFGFNLRRNFAYPYFSRDIAEFWRRWHISLSTWFRDYVYIPLGGNKGGAWKVSFNVLVVFTVSGFWHGARWTYIIWGVLNALLFLPLIISKRNRNNIDIVAKNSLLPSLIEVFQITATFITTTFLWIFFRAENVMQAISYISGIFSTTLFTLPKLESYIVLIFILIFVIIEWIGRNNNYAIAQIEIHWTRPFRWALYYIIVFAIYYYGANSEQVFIYFQF